MTTLLTEAMECNPDIGFRSYDRFFPSQDTMPQGGFGNLIALPLQGKSRESGNSVFIDGGFEPWPDQWAFLSGLRRLVLAEMSPGTGISLWTSVITSRLRASRGSRDGRR